jgi:CheY-like chemotaxis protein
MNPASRWILLAEDDPNDAELTLRALSESKAGEIVLARDGAEALACLRENLGQYSAWHTQPCVVLLDLKMPKIDGLEVLRQIKTDPRLRSIPVVMLTSSRQEQDVVQSYELGANAYVVKPVSFSEFRRALQEVGSFWAALNELPPQALVV